MRGALRLLLAGLLASSALAVPARVDDTDSEETDEESPRWSNLFQFPRGPQPGNRGRQSNGQKTITKTKTVHDTRTVTEIRTDIRTVTEREPANDRTVTVTDYKTVVDYKTITDREGRTITETKTIDEYRPTYI